MRQEVKEIEVAALEGVRAGDSSAVDAFDLVLHLPVLLRPVSTGSLLDGPVLVLDGHVVGVSDARIVQLSGPELILWHFLRRRKGGKRQKGTPDEHVDRRSEVLGRSRNLQRASEAISL